MPHEPDRGVPTRPGREAARIRERLGRIQEELKRARANARVLNEQVAHLRDVADDAETRKLVAQTPLADREWRDAKTDLDRHTRLHDETRSEIDGLLAEQDRLLDRLLELEETP